jgi:hypothetical protein
MSLGLQIFTLFHVVLSLLGIVAGLVVAFGFTKSKLLAGWNSWFLITTIATNVTGFMFPFHKLLPSHILGMISLTVLAVAAFALYGRHLAGGWRRTYAITAVMALYFNVFVLVVQLFEKVPALKELAPTQSEPPFKVAQLVVLLLFLVLGFLAAKSFHSEQARTASTTAGSAI